MRDRIRRGPYWPTVFVAAVACLAMVSAYLWGPAEYQSRILTLLGVLSTAAAAALRSAFGESPEDQ